jgi:hypothetical protein
MKLDVSWNSGVQDPATGRPAQNGRDGNVNPHLRMLETEVMLPARFALVNQ